MKIFTIGFKGKPAREFFGTLRRADVQKVIDIRRNNTSQLAGFTKGRDLKFFLEECFGIGYEHVLDFAPSNELLTEYQRRLKQKQPKEEAWAYYVERFKTEIAYRPIMSRFEKSSAGFDRMCLLCSEERPQYCHRRLLAEYLKGHRGDIEIEHL